MKLNVAFALVVSALVFVSARLNADDDSNGEALSVSVTGQVTAVDSTSVTVLGLKIALPTDLVVTSNGNCGGHGDDGIQGGHGKKKHDRGGNNGSNGNHGNGNNGNHGNGNNGNHGNGNNGNQGNGNNGNNGNHGGDDNGGGDDKGGGDDDGNCNNMSPTIAVGNFVKIDLTSDATPLTAVAIRDWGGYGEGGYSLKAPIQAVTSNGNTVTITVLGFVVDVSTAHFEGCNDDDTNTVPLTLADLAAGQNVELTLDPAKLPALVALQIKIRKGTNEVDVDTGHSGGDLTSDLTIDASQAAKGKDPNTGKLVKKIVKLHMVTRSTKFALRGFFPGRAKVVYSYQGHKHGANVKVDANGATNLKLKLGK